MHLNICFRYLGSDHVKGTCISSIVGKHYNADRHTRLHREGIAPIDAATVEYSKGEHSSIRLEDPIIDGKNRLVKSNNTNFKRSSIEKETFLKIYIRKE